MVESFAILECRDPIEKDSASNAFRLEALGARMGGGGILSTICEFLVNHGELPNSGPQDSSQQFKSGQVNHSKRNLS